MAKKQKEIAVKAGIIPFYRRPDGSVIMNFMVSSDARYGGAAPQLSKGNIDPGESVIDAAFREGYEELGLLESNVVANSLRTVREGLFELKSTSYDMTIFLVEVIDAGAFADPHYETAYTVWFTREQFAKYGRKQHREIVDMAFNLL
jgi:8-oxo-dGTP pyrophosphatase MutT (NUDIX family)